MAGPGCGNIVAILGRRSEPFRLSISSGIECYLEGRYFGFGQTEQHSQRHDVLHEKFIRTSQSRSTLKRFFADHLCVIIQADLTDDLLALLLW
jgi:hypothetical protein